MIGIPIFLIIFGGIKLIFGIERTKYVSVTAINLWIVGLIISTVYGFIIFKSFSHIGVYEESVSMQVPQDKALLIDLKNDKNLDRIYRYEDYIKIDDFDMIITSNEDDLFYGLPGLKIEMSENDIYELQVYYRARGKNNREAAERANHIVYQFSNTDSAILLDSYFKLSEGDVWREQQVDMILKVPEGKSVEFSDDMYKILNDRYHSGYKLSGETWLMTDSGLEKADIDSVLESEESEEDSDDETLINDNEQNESKPMSVISFLYFRLNDLYQTLI